MRTFLPLVDTAYDYSSAAGTVGTILGGLGAGLLAVLAAGLAVRAVRWGIPKIISFFSRTA